MKKIIVHLDLHDNKEKQKALKAVAALHGIDSIEMNMKDKKLTVIGPVDPVAVVSKLRKYWLASIVSVGPAKEPEKKEEKKEEKKDEKKEEPKKEEGKKEEEKKEEPKKEEEPKKGEEPKEEEGKKNEDKKDEKKDAKKATEEKKKPIDPNELMMYQNYQHLMNAYRQMQYNPYMNAQHNPYATAHPNPYVTTQYFVRSVEENPNSCSIL